jgi:hypothetical protein
MGRIVFCWTLASIRSTTSPPRWISPRIGGFSFAALSGFRGGDARSPDQGSDQGSE